MVGAVPGVRGAGALAPETFALACRDVHGHDAEAAGFKVATREAPSKPLAPIFVLQVHLALVHRINQM